MVAVGGSWLPRAPRPLLTVLRKVQLATLICFPSDTKKSAIADGIYSQGFIQNLAEDATRFRAVGGAFVALTYSAAHGKLAAK
jgi:hypothetical protein